MDALPTDPLAAHLSHRSPMVLDGGLATELEARGCDLDDELWSALYLLRNPDAIRRVHGDYLAAGADVVVAATYQATLEGFRRRGLTVEDSRSMLLRAIELALEAREKFLADRPADRSPLVAASIGPYGAYRADGSEYTGDYDRDETGLVEFHAERFEILARSGADFLACETLPSAMEARALARVLRATPGVWAWFSFSCRDGLHLADGTPIAEIAAELDGAERVAALGVNCTPPRFVPELIDELRRVCTRPIVVYPNSGESYDVERRCWIGERDPGDFARGAADWVRRGATIVGGCCRTGPEHVRQIRRRLFAS